MARDVNSVSHPEALREHRHINAVKPEPSYFLYAVCMSNEAKFYIGQVIQHLKFNYRGVIFDVDADFQGTEEWYELVARSRPPKNRPWYHILVENSASMTYVAERHLEVDKQNCPVEHPALGALFHEYRNGVYIRNRAIN